MSQYLALNLCFKVAIGTVVKELHATLMSKNIVLNLCFEVAVGAVA